MSSRGSDMDMDAHLNETERAVVERARLFARDEIAPKAPGWAVTREVPLETTKAAAEAGLCGLVVPEADGGSGLGISAMARVVEELAAVDFGFPFGLVVHNNLAGSIARNGSDEQRRRFLPDMLAARRIGAFLLTEPGSGSDAAAIATRAERDGEGWVLNGEKAWITNTVTAEVLSVYAQTDPAAGWRGIACFLVDADTRGVKRGPTYEMMGCHAAGVGGFRFEDCRIGEADLFLAPGEAFKAALFGIDIARIIVAAGCCGMLRTGIDTALSYAMQRRAFGQATADFQGLQWMLADAETDWRAARLLTVEAGRLHDAGDPRAPLAAAHAKKFAPRICLARLADCMQVMGAAGYSHDYPLARHLAAAKMAQIVDGTTEIQNVVISRAMRKAAG
ncbi:MAG TPA: acyl-CoA dehydrogenase family protein [Alphaproteobacteria bacterium]|nr:acyl-CoA dehydrogenase family protein [Alphaproteobacteria bacterium]MDP7429241.1 acyl-CoA dehydrogenase family protein [Alphaproteobacteria bacterium]HJM52055.1 acyl-CoA dehydrogenase family protein [Alphaproteobacteria bacterium]